MTLLELLEQYTVEIPLIQRDYAQGRTDVQTALVRKTLLQDMKKALCGETPPLSLNFVYGGVVGEDRFIPIDGQQRLTTLFLLHLYAFRQEENRTGLLEKFTYETRESARRFFQYIIQNRAQIFECDAEYPTPSSRITDSESFVFSWRCDPTVQSALVVLDAIAEIFAKVDGLAERLRQTAPPLLSFHFLPIDNLGSGDDLYIKLNARGRPLTQFENFKARLLGRLKTLSLPFDAADFARRFDGAWTDLFWQRKKSVAYEEEYYQFFKILLVNNGQIAESDAAWVWSLDYESIPARVYRSAYYLLNYLCRNPGAAASQMVWRALENPTAPAYTAFHAVSVFLCRCPELAGTQAMRDWVRLFRNLTDNSTIDDYEAAHRAVREIDRFAREENALSEPLNHVGSIARRYEKGRTGRVLRASTAFDRAQLTEEAVKAGIILAERAAEGKTGGAFETEIYRAEALPFFNGQIRAGLYFAKDADAAYGYDLETFRARWAKLELLFRDFNAGDSPPRLTHGIAIRRALLSLGDYTQEAGGYRTLCSDHTDAGGSISLKALFSRNGPLTGRLLDALDVRQSAEQALARVVRCHGGEMEQSDWRYSLIRYPALFSFMSPRFYRIFFGEENILLVKNLSANGYNQELFTCALQCELEKRFAGTKDARVLSGADAWWQDVLENPDAFENVGKTTFGDYFLVIVAESARRGQYIVRFQKQKSAFVIERAGKKIFCSKTRNPISETAEYIETHLVKDRGKELT